MALGGNLKKKSLIPGEEAQDKKETKATRAKKPTRSAKSSDKPVAKKAKKTTVKKKSTPKKTSQPKATSTKKVDVPKTVLVEEEQPRKSTEQNPAIREGLLTRAEYERRHRLHEKFNQEIKELSEKQVHLIVFRIEQEEFALEISKVNEVVVTPTITRMPQAPKYVPGIATIRGKGVVTLDLAYKLGYVDSTENLAERAEYTIVVKTERFTVGVLVPEVPVSQMIAGGRIQAADDSVSETSLDETYIKGLIRTGDRVIFFIDIDEMVEGDRLKSRLVEV